MKYLCNVKLFQFFSDILRNISFKKNLHHTVQSILCMWTVYKIFKIINKYF